MAKTKRKPQRDARGRFVKGCSAGPGRPPKIQEVEFVYALRSACPPHRVAAIVDKLASMAEAGDLKAARLLLQHLLPSETLRLQIDAKNDHGYRMAGESSTENNRRMMQTLYQKIIEKEAYEEAVARHGFQVPTDRRSVGQN